MKPITRIEHYLAAIAGLQDYTPEEPITRLEKYLAYINGKTDSYPEPVTRIDQLIVMQIEKTELPFEPVRRLEWILAGLCNEPVTREEWFWVQAVEELNAVKELPYCLNFLGNEDFKLKTSNTTKSWDGKLEYSTDGEAWSTWDGTEIASARKALYLRGSGNTKITTSSSNKFILTGTNALKIACNGNIENLLDYETVEAGGHPTVDGYCFYYMFNGCTQLTEAPDMPTTLTNAGYACAYMFQNCTSLTKAPKLPATTMAMACYQGMFKGCTSLTKAPELPATELLGYCYSEMFYNCTSLETAPELPATTMYDHCYSSMFDGCASLVDAPALPATKLANRCFNYMFRNCTSLTTLPVLSATTLADACYYNMFQNCTNIKLSTMQTGEYQTEYRIPKSGTGTTADTALNGMFVGTGGTFTGTPEINTTYYTSNNMV